MVELKRGLDERGPEVGPRRGPPVPSPAHRVVPPGEPQQDAPDHQDRNSLHDSNQCLDPIGSTVGARHFVCFSTLSFKQHEHNSYVSDSNGGIPPQQVPHSNTPGLTPPIAPPPAEVPRGRGGGAVARAVLRRGHLLLEMPSGTGKTITLLALIVGVPGGGGGEWGGGWTAFPHFFLYFISVFFNGRAFKLPPENCVRPISITHRVSSSTLG